MTATGLARMTKVIVDKFRLSYVSKYGPASLELKGKKQTNNVHPNHDTVLLAR